MSAGVSIAGDMQSAMALAQSAPVKTPRMATNVEAAKKAATEFEGVLVSQMMGAMFEGIKTDGPFGGGQGEEMFRSVMMDEYGKQVAKRGGLGLSDSIMKSLLSHQEAKAHPAQTNPVETPPGETKAETKNDAGDEGTKADNDAASFIATKADKVDFKSLATNPNLGMRILPKTSLPRVVSAAP